MRALRLGVVVGCLAGGAACGGGGPASGPSTPPPPPPPPVRTRIPPTPVAFAAGPTTDVLPPVFGTAPSTRVSTPFADHDARGGDARTDADLAGASSTRSTHDLDGDVDLRLGDGAARKVRTLLDEGA